MCNIYFYMYCCDGIDILNCNFLMFLVYEWLCRCIFVYYIMLYNFIICVMKLNLNLN